MESKIYIMYIDIKVSVWNRNIYQIAAKNPIEAREKLLKLYESDDLHNDAIIDSETLDNSMEEILLEDNSGNPTVELTIIENNKEKLFWDNIKQKIE